MNCRQCKYIRSCEDGIPPESKYFWYECQITGYDNLKSFPFENTKCKQFADSGHFIQPTITEKLQLLKQDNYKW